MFKYLNNTLATMKKFWASALGVIILGALGGGLWENVFKPASGFLVRFFLNISVLGVESFKNNIYIQVAEGLHEQPSLDVLTLILGFSMAFVVVVVLTKFLVDSDKNSRFRKFFKIQYNMMNNKLFISLYFLFFIALTSVLLLQEEYINKSITYFNQLEKIAGPYLSVDR